MRSSKVTATNGLARVAAHKGGSMGMMKRLIGTVCCVLAATGVIGSSRSSANDDTEPLEGIRRNIETAHRLQAERRIQLLELYTEQMQKAMAAQQIAGASERDALRQAAGWGHVERVQFAKNFLLERIHQGTLDLSMIASRFQSHRSALLAHFDVGSVYLAIPFQESRFTATAFNTASVGGRQETVKGLWQIVESTGRDYGLQVTTSAGEEVGTDPDERYDVAKSTAAARRYLTDLEQHYGVSATSEEVVLVICAYHLGQNNLDKVIEHYGNRDFWSWEPVEEYSFGKQSFNYPPLVLAAWEILHEHEVFK